jgi:hypothetical protein
MLRLLSECGRRQADEADEITDHVGFVVIAGIDRTTGPSIATIVTLGLKQVTTIVVSGFVIKHLANSWLAAGVHSLAPRSEPSDSSPPRTESPGRGGGIEVSTRRRVDQTNRPRPSEVGQRVSSATREVRVGAEGRTALEEGPVVAVEHRLNGQLSMEARESARYAPGCV